MSLINFRPDLSSGAKGPIFGMSLHLQPYFAYASSKGSGESARICVCADSPEPSLLDDTMSTQIKCAGSFYY